MQIAGHRRLGDVFQHQADSLLVRDNQGNPVLLILQMDDHTLLVEQAGTADFERRLKLFGIDKGPLVQTLKTHA